MKKSRILVYIGMFLIAYALYNLGMMGFKEVNGVLGGASLVNQEGFAPLIAPESDLSNGDALTNADPIANQPDRIVIPKISLDAPVETARALVTQIDDEEYVQFLVPESYAAGFHENSAALGEIGNTVISGHHNAYGEVFGDLDLLDVGDVINLYNEDTLYQYVIANAMILPEMDEPLEVRMENARWILPSDDERVTIVTCWPAESNSHRLILVGVPIESLEKDDEVCDVVSVSALIEDYESVYLQIISLIDYPNTFQMSELELIEKLHIYHTKVEESDPDKCQVRLKLEMKEYINLKSLQIGFQQIGYKGEETSHIQDGLRSYEKILESIFELEGAEIKDIEEVNGMPSIPVSESIDTQVIGRNKEDQSLNIRQRAQSDSRFLGSLGSGRETVVIGKSLDGEWLLIPHRNSLGWVNAAFVQLNTSIEMIPTVTNEVVQQIFD